MGQAESPVSRSPESSQICPRRPLSARQRTSSQFPAGVWLRGLVYGGSGYADETLPVVLGLAEHNIPIELHPVQFLSDTRNLLSPSVCDAVERLKLQRVDPGQSVFLQWLPAHDLEVHVYGRRRVARTMFESDRIPPGWSEACEGMDEVWVPSQFNRRTFAAGGVSEHKLRVVPAGVDAELFRPGLEPLRIPHARGFNFLSVFEWAQRKGPDVLIRAYVGEFKPDEDVALIIKAYPRPDPTADLLPKLAYFVEREAGVSLEKAPPIILLPGFLPNADVPKLYATADAFVLPSRGEGYGRPYMEALACECPVIATRWSGQLDFLHDHNSYLIDARVVPVPADTDIELFAGHCWAEPDVDHLRQLMRHVFAHREEAKRLAVQGRREMVERWNWNVIIRQWVVECEGLLA
jgi:glycosyltransferase involved in cell wall biosynthesis